MTMIRLLLSGLLLIASVTVNSQNFTLPTVYLDSLFFEVERGRACEKVIVSQTDLIAKLGDELVANGTALKLSTNQIQTLEQMNANLKQQYKLQGERFVLREKENKRKLRKRTVVIIGQVVVIVLLLI